METHSKKIMIVAGEASGDNHAAHLITEILKIDPDVQISGYGGKNMAAAGADILFDLTKLAVVGFWEVLNKYLEFRSLFKNFLDHADRIRPDCVILVDYPGFNLRLAKKLKQMNLKVIYYISPQVWAWKENRVKQIRQYVDEMLVLFPFEVDFYKKHGIDVTLVGHPLAENIKVTTPRKTLLESNGLIDERLTIGLLPGSREKEIKAMLPVMLGAAKLLMEDYPHIQFLIPRAETVPTELLESLIDKDTPNIKVIDDQYYNTLNACEACVVTSGTATLETALMEKPMVVIYRTSLFTYLLAKLFVRIDNIGLVNVVAGKQIVPECIQDQANPKRIASTLKDMLGNEPELAGIKIELRRVKESLGGKGASRRAAKAVLAAIS